MTNTAKIFANINETRRRMRIAQDAGVDLDTADSYQRVHGRAAIDKQIRAEAHDSLWWLEEDWRDDPPVYAREWIEIAEHERAPVLMLVRPAEAVGLARIARQVHRLAQAGPQVEESVINTQIELLKRKHPDALALWRETWQAERALDLAVAEALKMTPAARDRMWGRAARWLWDARRGQWYRNPEWVEGVKRERLDLADENVY